LYLDLNLHRSLYFSLETMAPFLESVTSFKDVPINADGVDTLQFLKASDGLANLFDLFGSAAFTTVQSDIKGNVAKVRTRYEANPALSSTLEKLVTNELAEKKKTASEGLMWLLRGQSFTCKGLQHVQANPSEELAGAFTKSYGDTLKPHHNFVVKGIFAVAMKACPYKNDFFTKLAADPSGGSSVPQDKLNVELNSWLTGLDSIVTRVQKFYADNDIEKKLKNI